MTLATKYNMNEGMAAIITGASSGIGRALAIKLAERYKARLVINARSKLQLDETADLVKKAGGTVIALPGDISYEELSQQLVDTCIAKYGCVELLVNNAGLAKPGPLTELKPEDWRYVFGVNFFGALYATYAVLPYFLKQSFGKIVNVSSVAGKVAFPGSVCYSASKFAMTGMSEGMAAELAGQNIDVITVCPGWVRTDFFKKNNHPETANPTIIARQKDFKGWLMRNCLSISSDSAADEIIKACQAGGSKEIILTGPGQLADTLSRFSPQLMHMISKKIPASR